jgi:hypothetical protein
MSAITISGEWIAGPNDGERATLSGVRAGLVYGLRANGTRVSGSASDFVADTGETGEAVLGLLLPNPRASTLLRGTVRESLAAAYSIATLGRQETRAWDECYTYVADDGEGNSGIVKFDPDGASGALNDHDFHRNFDVDGAVALAPVGQRGTLRSLVDLPIFQYNGRRTITSVFWTEGGLLCGPEAWFKIYIFGGELLRRELMDDREWQGEANEYYEISEALVDIIIRITGRLLPLNPIALTREELSLLVPDDAPFRTEALEQLFGGGVITPA